MKKILVPTDFSPVADHAFSYAMEIGAAFNSELLLYHVYHVSKVDYNRDFPADEQPLKKELERKMELTQLKFQQSITEKGLRVHGKVAREPILALFERKVEEHEIDMIVLGSKGASGLKKVIFGSVAATALNMAKIPIFIIPPESTTIPIKHIVLAVDHDKISKAVLSPLQQLAVKFGAKVTILNVKTETSPTSPPKPKVDLDGVESHYLEVPLSNTINDTISKFVKTNDCDVLCMIRREKGFFERLLQGSNTVNQAYRNQLPLLVLPES
ncbi:MAG: universal stress protein [Saprospiraceae bacterium]|nr:universal stress protein [Saprospiraceae bacterium]